jgi:hypothetical protein
MKATVATIFKIILAAITLICLPVLAVPLGVTVTAIAVFVMVLGLVRMFSLIGE